MTIDSIKTEIAALTPAEWGQIFSWVIGDERLRREAEPTRAQVIGELQEAGTLPAPESVTTEQVDAGTTAPAWADPGTDHMKMYRQGAVVTHAGKVWESITHVLNCWEPGADNGLTWAEYTPSKAEPTTSETTPTPPEFVQPTGAHDAYPLGAQVTYNGMVCESLIDANTYSPDAYPAGWKQINPA